MVFGTHHAIDSHVEVIRTIGYPRAPVICTDETHTTVRHTCSHRIIHLACQGFVQVIK
jgi:hypothetical protein